MLSDVGSNEVATQPADPAEAREDESQPWPTEDDAILKWVKDRRKKAEDHLGDWYDDAVQAFRFREGEQWTEDEISVIEGEERVAAKFNRVGPIINAILGQEVCNRQEVKYLPRRVGEVNAADPMNDAVKWVREGCNAEDEDSDAFADMVTCGMGWTVTRMDYEANPDGMPEVLRRDPMLMRWDYAARRKNLADMRWVQADYWMSEEDVEDRWPESDVQDSVNLKAPTDRLKPHDASDAWKYKNDAAGQDRYNDELRVIHHVERFAVPMYRMVDPASGQTKDYSKADYAKLKSNAKRMGIELPQCLQINKAVYWHAWTVGGTVLDSGQAPAQKDFPYQCMTCYRERETGYWYGVVRAMMDPQKYANLFMSLMMSILKTGAKSGVLYETGAFVNPKKGKADWAKYASAIELSPGTLEKGAIQAKPQQAMPPGAADLLQLCIASIRDVTGVNVDMLGGAQRDQPGIVEEMRTKAGLTILAGVFDAIRLYRKRQGVLLAEFVQRFISDGRLIRIIGKAGQQFIPLIRQDSLEYDVIVDESPASRDVKERTWEALQVIVPEAMKAGMPIPSELLDYAPIPESLAMAWKQEIAQQKQQPPQPSPQVQVAQIKAQADQAKVQAQQAGDAQKAQADQQATMAKMQADQAKEQAQMQADMVISRMEAQFKAQTDENRNQLEAQRSLLETKYQMQLEAFKANQNQQTQFIIAQIKASAQVQSADITASKQQAESFYATEMQQ